MGPDVTLVFPPHPHGQTHVEVAQSNVDGRRERERESKGVRETRTFFFLDVQCSLRGLRQMWFLFLLIKLV